MKRLSYLLICIVLSSCSTLVKTNLSVTTDNVRINITGYETTMDGRLGTGGGWYVPRNSSDIFMTLIIEIENKNVSKINVDLKEFKLVGENIERKPTLISLDTFINIFVDGLIEIGPDNKEIRRVTYSFPSSITPSKLDCNKFGEFNIEKDLYTKAAKGIIFK